MLTRDPWIRALVVVMLMIAGINLLGILWQAAHQFSDLILLFFLAWLISFVLEPLVAALHYRARLPRTVAVLTAYVLGLVVFFWAIIQLLPRLSAQLIQLANDLPGFVDWANHELLLWQAFLASQGLNIAPESLLSYQDVLRHVEQVGPLIIANTVGLATGVANLLFQVFIILILSYYMTLDGHRIGAALLAAIPRAYRDDARYFFASVNRAFGGFMRGQITQAAIYGLGTAAIMSLAGLNMVLLSSVLAFVFMMVPFAGPFLALALPIGVSLITAPEVLLALMLALFILQQIVVNVIAPRLMSQTIGMHPLLVFVAVLGGAKVAGIWGAVFGVPIVGVFSTMVSFYFATLEERQARLVHAVSQLPIEQQRNVERVEQSEVVTEAIQSSPEEDDGTVRRTVSSTVSSATTVQRGT